MIKPETLEQLRTEKERAETQLVQEQHKLERLENQHRHLPYCQKADRQDHLYRPCAFQPDRKRDNGGQNQASAP